MTGPYENHNLRDVWNYVKSHPDRYETARMHSDRGEDFIDVYPKSGISEESIIEEITNEFDVEQQETREFEDQLRFVES